MKKDFVINSVQGTLMSYRWAGGGSSCYPKISVKNGVVFASGYGMTDDADVGIKIVPSITKRRGYMEILFILEFEVNNPTENRDTPKWFSGTVTEGQAKQLAPYCTMLTMSNE